MDLSCFKQVWLVDFEFSQPSGERPVPHCMVALELCSGAISRLGPDELSGLRRAPFPTGRESLFVAYYASAEMNCFLALGWPLPTNVLDLFVEFSNQTNGLAPPCGRGLLGALAYHGLTGVRYAEKAAMRDLALRGGPFTDEELRELVNYCESDVRAMAALLPKVQPLDLGRALLRGRYMRAAARMESTGVPIDAPVYRRLRDGWDGIKGRLVSQLHGVYTVKDQAGNVKYSVYDGNVFKADRFDEWLLQNDIPWPRLDSGALDLKDDTFRQMARVYPQVSELRELRHALSQLRLADLAVGKDGRNRCMLSAFGSSTGRNQPSNSKFIFGNSVWLRGLIRPEPGRFVAYLDWSGQEYGIAAALSQDGAMMADYATGDPYLIFAKHLGMVPPDATKKTHPSERECFKVALGLGAMYGAGARHIAAVIGKPLAYASHLLQEHRRRYACFWAWRDAVVDHAQLTGKLWTAFGWDLHVRHDVNPRSLVNYPMQGNGAEMMRMACILVTEANIELCAPVHDALLIGGRVADLDGDLELAQRLMARASQVVLGGFELRTGVETVVYPGRYRDDKRGGPMWDRVMGLLPADCPGPTQDLSRRGPPGHSFLYSSHQRARST